MTTMPNKSIKTKVAFALWALSAGLIVAWLAEAWVEGFGVISQYGGPLGMALNLLAGLLFQRKAPKQ